MTNRFESTSDVTISAADRVYATMTDMALWSAQEYPVQPTNLEHAEMLIKIHMLGIQNLCYSAGAIRKW